MLATIGILVTELCVMAVAQNVLIVDLLDGLESTQAGALGYTVTEVDTTQFSAMTTQEFASYDALIFGDNFCSTDITDLDFLNATKHIWSPAITGNIIILGTDPSDHAQEPIQGAIDVINAGISFAVNASSTGLYFSLACYYMYIVGPVEIESLTEFGNFSVEGKGNDTINDVHIVASSPGFNSSLADADLSDWYISVHEVFVTYPSDFIPLAIARNIQGDGEQSFADGSSGIPYILTRGVTPVGCGNGIYEPQYGEECDNGSLNGTPGESCSSACRCIYGVLDTTLGTCISIPGVTTAATTLILSSTTSFESIDTQTSTFPITTVIVSETSTFSSVQIAASTFTSGNLTAITTITSTAVRVSDFTTLSVVETTLILTSGVEVTEVIPVATTTERHRVGTAGAVTKPTQMSLPPPNGVSSRVGHSRAPSSAQSLLPSSSTSEAGGHAVGTPGVDYVTDTPSASQPATPTQTGPLSGSSNSTSSSTQGPLPAIIGQSVLMGCYGSDNNYPGYTLTQSDPLMTLEMCIATCSDHAYAGVYSTDCYCSNIEAQLTILPGLDCNVPCPGNSSEHCGGLSASSLFRRQTVPDKVLLSIYAINGIQVPGSAVVITSDGIPIPVVTTVGPGAGVTMVPSGDRLTTQTFLSTSARTITSCATTAVGCTVGSVTNVVVAVASVGVVPLSAKASISSTMSSGNPGASAAPFCVNDYCASRYVLEPYTQTPYPGLAVFVRKPCTCPGGYTYVAAPCSGTACTNMALYTPVPYSDSSPPPASVAVCQPQACENCSGGIQFVQIGRPTSTTRGASSITPSAVVVISRTASTSPFTTSTSEGYLTTTPSSSGVFSNPPGASSSPTVVVAGAYRLVPHPTTVVLICALLLLALI